MNTILSSPLGYVLAFLLPATVAHVLSVVVTESFRGSPLMRTNYRGAQLPTAVGVVVPFAIIGSTALLTRPFQQFSTGSASIAPLGALAVVVFAFALLGFVDDVVGDGQSGGFRGHLRSFAEGRITSGALKMFGGPAITFAVFLDSLGWIVAFRAALLLSLCANVGNLFDRAPGRTVKTFSFAAMLLTLFAALPQWSFDAMEFSGTRFTEIFTRYPSFSAVVIGTAVGIGIGDLREQFMLGDAGSNTFGVIIGFLVLAEFGAIGQWIAVAVALAINLVSEQISFGAVIDRIGFLRTIDRYGAVEQRKSF